MLTLLFELNSMVANVDKSLKGLIFSPNKELFNKFYDLTVFIVNLLVKVFAKLEFLLI